jgi:hypothetical protein
VSARRRLVPIGIDDPAWRGLTEADLWPGKPCREEREAAEIERLATTEEMLEAALGYAGLGWRIHPIRPREKLPILDEWQKRATTDARLIKRWFARTPDANVAVATGSGSGIMVIDVDGGDGETSLARLERQHGALPDFAPQQTTGNGWQRAARSATAPPGSGKGSTSAARAAMSCCRRRSTRTASATGGRKAARHGRS